MTPPAWACKRAAAKRGITFLEILTVLAVLGIVSSLALPAMLGSLEASTLEAAAREVESAFLFARRQAVLQGQATRVATNAAGHWLQVEQTVAAGMPATGASVAQAAVETLTYQVMPDPLNTAQSFRLLYDGTSSEGVTLQSADFGGSANVVFSALGVPSSAGAIALQGSRRGLQVILSADGQVSRNE